jgi:beta-lactamase class A
MKIAIILAALIGAFPAIPSYADDRLALSAERIEERLGARVGYAVLDVTRNTSWLRNADDRFPMTSTFKVLACAALLSSEIPDEPSMTIGSLESYSPATESMVGDQVSPYQLCEITMRTSDNTAANLVLEALGGPSAVTGFVRSIGDETTRLDRTEPDLNTATPGDERDTTSPRAIAETLRELVLGDVLSEGDRTTLIGWLRSNEVAAPLLSASIPDDWSIADRSGAGGFGSRGIVAALWPTPERPVVVAFYLTETNASLDDRNAAIAEFGLALRDVLQH